MSTRGAAGHRGGRVPPARDHLVPPGPVTAPVNGETCANARGDETLWHPHVRVDVLAADPGLKALSCGYRLPTASHRPGVGAWDPARLMPEPAGGLGLLLLGGLVWRVVGLGVRSVAEVLGAGDLLQPWEFLDNGATVSAHSTWHVLEFAHVAVLDEPATRALSRLPGAMLELQQRATRRIHSATLQLAVVAHPALGDRLILTMWHLAERWGKVTPDGVSLRLAGLTHERLALLVGARRPSVSTALKDLERRGCLSRARGGTWLLHALPDELLAFAPALAAEHRA